MLKRGEAGPTRDGNIAAFPVQFHFQGGLGPYKTATQRMP